MNVLVLDDDAELLDTLREVMSDLGHAVTAVNDSQRAVQLGAETAFDIIVTDIRMPGLDGLEALERMRQSNPEVKSLVITGYSSETDILRAMRLGVGEYLSKPFSIQELSRALQRMVDAVLEQRRQRAQRQQLRGLWLYTLDEPPLGSLLTQILGDVDAALALLLRARQPLDPQLANLLPPEIAGFELTPAHLEAEQRARSVARGEEGLAIAEPAPNRRQQLALAQALEQGGKPEAAFTSYRELAEQRGREASQARLGMARILFGARRFPEAAQEALEALALASGPSARAEIGLDAALYVSAGDREKGLELVREMVLAAQELALPGRAALGRVGYARLQQQAPPADAVATLLLTRNLDLLLDSCWWSVPYLFGQPQGAELDAALTALVRERPGTIHRMLPNFSPTDKLRLLQFHPHPETLKLLSEDVDGSVRRAALQILQLGAPQVAAPPLRILTLGRAEVFTGEQRIPDQAWKKNQKAFYLLVYLAGQGGRPVSEDVISEIFWPQDEAQGRRNLTSVWSILKKSVGPTPYLVRGAQGLQLSSELPWWQDYSEIRQTLQEGRRHHKQGEEDRAAAHLRAAAQLYRGPFLEGCYLDFAVQWREQLEYQIVPDLVLLAELDLKRNAPQSAQEVLEQALEIDPASTEAFLGLMQAQLQAQRYSDVMRTFERCQKALRKHLQVEPPVAALELYHRARLLL